MLRRLPYLLLFLAFLSGEVGAQSPNFIHYTTRDGLPSNETYDLLQDPMGFIWVGTDRGLARFDGRNFDLFTTRNGLAANLITGLYLDHQGAVWCNSYRNGVSKVARENITIPDWSVKLGKTGVLVDDLLFHESGQITLGFNDPSLQHAHILIAPDQSITTPPWPADSGSLISFRLENGRYAFGQVNHPGSDSFVLRLNEESRRFSAPLPPYIMDAVATSLNKVYFTSKNFLYAIEDTTLSRHELPGSILNSLLIDKQNGLWVGMKNHGVNYYPNGNLEQSPSRFLEGYSVTSVLQDREGGFWFSTIESGIFYLPFPEISTWTFENGLPEKGITHAAVDDSLLWLGFKKGSLASMNLSKPQMGVRLQAKYDYIFDLVIDHAQWLHLSGSYRSTEEPDFQEYNPVASMLETEPGTLLLANLSYGLQRREKGEVLWETKAVPRVNSMAKHPDGSVWLGSIAGLYRYNQDQIDTLFESNDMLRKGIRCLAFHGERAFIGIEGYGVMVIDGQDTCLLNSDNGLKSDFALTITSYQNQVWIATTNGIDYLNADFSMELLPMAGHLGLENGLPDLAVNHIEFLGDSAWIMTDNGLAIIPLHLIKQPVGGVNVYLRSISVDGLPVQEDQLNRLSYKQNNLRFGYQAINFRNSYSMAYRYRLLGASDTSWNITSDPSISYAGLAPGNYTFQLRALVAEQPGPMKEVKFFIESPFWNTSWFFWSLMTAGAGILLMLIYLNIRRVNRKAAQKQKEDALHYQALRAQMRPHFIYNSLNLLRGFLVHNRVQTSVNYLEIFSTLVRKVFDHSAVSSVPLDEELKTLKLYVELQQVRYPNRIEFEISQSGDFSNLSVPPLLLQPFVENAIEHGILPLECPGCLWLRLERTNNCIQIEIADNGIGLDASRKIQQRKARNLESGQRPSGALKVSWERILSIARTHNVDCAYSIKDAKNITGSSGTIVSFNLPLIFSS